MDVSDVRHEGEGRAYVVVTYARTEDYDDACAAGAAALRLALDESVRVYCADAVRAARGWTVTVTDAE